MGNRPSSIKVNVQNVDRLANKLKETAAFAYPTVIRNTLNNAAFEARKLVPAEAKEIFTTRNKGLFKAFVQVEKATGKDVRTMQSAVGIRNDSKSKLASDLSQQEIGGTVQDRGLIPMKQARVSSSNEKSVKKSNYLNNIQISRSKKKGTGTGFIMISKNGSAGTIFATKKGKKNGLTPIYSFKRNRKANLKRRAFIQPAALKARNKIPEYFVEAAERMIKKIMK